MRSRRPRVAYGVDILDFALGERAPHTAAVQVTGEGAAGDQGSDAWVTGCARIQRRINPPQAAGRRAAPTAWARCAARTTSKHSLPPGCSVPRRRQRAGWLLISGAPQVEPGDNVKVSGLPQSSLDGTYRVADIVHEFDARRGFRSRLRVVKAGAGAGGGLLDLVGGLL